MNWLAEKFETIARWAHRHSPQTLFLPALITIVGTIVLLPALSAGWFNTATG